MIAGEDDLEVGERRLREAEFQFGVLRDVRLSWSRLELLRIDPGLPQKFPKKPRARRSCIGSPNAILNANRTQRMSTIAKATKAIIMEFTDQRFCITPP